MNSYLTLVLAGLFAMHTAAKDTSYAPDAANRLLTDARTAPVYTVNAYDPKRDPESDLKMTVAKARAGGKRILIQVGGDWCGWCKLMNKYFHENEKVADALAKDFLIMKVNMSSENDNKAFLSNFPPAQGYPHLYVLESNGKFLHSQGTAVLEQGKGYNEKTVLDFLAKWAPL